MDINLIPLEFRRSLVTRPRLFMLTVILTAGVVFPRVYAAQVQVGSKVADLRQQLVALNSAHEAETRRIASQNAEQAQLDQELTLLREQVVRTSAKTSVATQTLRRFAIAPALELLLSAEMEGLQVASVTWQEPNLTVEGSAPNLPALMSYTRKLQEPRRFRSLSLRLLEDVSGSGKVAATSDVQAFSQAEATVTSVPAPVASAANRGLAFVLLIEVAMDGGS